jgi:formyl-CoA transferase/CoA:oxalate CoA-transferase
VYCSISGYGQDGPDRDRPGYESLVAARIGVMAQGAGDPVYPGVPIGSTGAGLLAVIGILAALLEREDTGIGQHVDTSIADGVLAFMNMMWEDLERLPDSPTGAALRPSRRLLVGSMRCGDGEYLGVHTGANGSYGRLMEAMGLSDRVRPAPGNREKTVPLTAEETEVVATEVPRLFASRPRDEWRERLRAHDVCAIPVLRQGEALAEPQTVHNQVAIVLDDPELGPVTQVGVAARLAASPGRVNGPAPRVGEHTDEILRELGYDDEVIAEMRADGVIA